MFRHFTPASHAGGTGPLVLSMNALSIGHKGLGASIINPIQSKGRAVNLAQS